MEEYVHDVTGVNQLPTSTYVQPFNQDDYQNNGEHFQNSATTIVNITSWSEDYNCWGRTEWLYRLKDKTGENLGNYYTQVLFRK